MRHEGVTLRQCPKIMSSGVIGPLEELYARSWSRYSTMSCATCRRFGSSSSSEPCGFRTVKNSLSATGTSWRCGCSILCEDQIASTDPVAIRIISVIEQMMSGWTGVEVEPDLPPFRTENMRVRFCRNGYLQRTFNTVLAASVAVAQSELCD
jgi:hypothetical protein